MKHHYKDIRALTSEPPLWFDEDGVPRYCEFSHGECANIYAREVVLLMIACQNCGAVYEVCLSQNGKVHGQPTLASQIKDGSIGYGDPPNMGCCAAGPTMSCMNLRVLQYWSNPSITKWERSSALEISLPDSEDDKFASDEAPQ